MAYHGFQIANSHFQIAKMRAWGNFPWQNRKALSTKSTPLLQWNRSRDLKKFKRMQLLEAAHMGLGVTGARLALVNLVARRGWGGPPN